MPVSKEKKYGLPGDGITVSAPGRRQLEYFVSSTNNWTFLGASIAKLPIAFVCVFFLGASAPNPKLKIAKLPIAFVCFFLYESGPLWQNPNGL